MKRLTDTERECLRLSKTLPVVSEETCEIIDECGADIDRIAESALDFVSYNSSFYCGGQWIKAHDEGLCYFGQLIAVGDYQVIRYFVVDYCQRSLYSWFRYKFGEVAQRWLKDGKEVAFLAKKAHSNHWHWCLNTEMHISRKGYDFGTLNDIRAVSLCDKALTWDLFHSLIETYEYWDTDTYDFITSPYGEYLAKCEPILFRLGQGVKMREVATYEKSIKVAHRHHYRIEDAEMWLDYLGMLDYLGKDILNPHYICPVDLKKEHDACVAKRQAKAHLEAELRKRKQLFEAEHAEEIYAERMGKYLGLAFGNSDLEIKPLQSVKEFVEEGDAMHHCVYANGYYKAEKNCIILSAKDRNGNRVETIEVNLSSFKIVQSRGVCNQSTPYHDEIVNLVKQNIGQIRNIANNRVALS